MFGLALTANVDLVQVILSLKRKTLFHNEVRQAHPVDPSKFYLDGAYACSFQSKDDKEPFSSVCFKVSLSLSVPRAITELPNQGTSTAKDSAVDVYFKPYAGGNLWGTEVSHGFWNGLFGKFKVPDTEKSTGFGKPSVKSKHACN